MYVRGKGNWNVPHTGESYVGDWHENHYHGNDPWSGTKADGSEEWAKEGTYEGNFVYDMFHGQGRWSTRLGDVYVVGLQKIKHLTHNELSTI